MAGLQDLKIGVAVVDPEAVRFVLDHIRRKGDAIDSRKAQDHLDAFDAGQPTVQGEMLAGLSAEVKPDAA